MNRFIWYFVLLIILFFSPFIIGKIGDELTKSDYAKKIENIEPNTLVKATNIFGNIDGMLYIGEFYSRRLNAINGNICKKDDVAKLIDNYEKKYPARYIDIGTENERYLVVDINNTIEAFFTIPVYRNNNQEKRTPAFEPRACVSIKDAYFYKNGTILILGVKK